MAALIKFTVFVMLLIALASSRSPSIENWPNLPWTPTWVPCTFDYEAASHAPVCNDCSSTIKCTPVGAVVRNCFGGRPFCVEGRCSKLPSAECQDVETVTDVNV